MHTLSIIWNMKYELDPEEREILEAFERGELKSEANAEQEIRGAREAARNTFNKNKRVNLRLTERDFDRARILLGSCQEGR